LNISSRRRVSVRIGISVGVAEAGMAVGGTTVGVKGIGGGVGEPESTAGWEGPGVGTTWIEKLQAASSCEHKNRGTNHLTRFIAYSLAMRRIRQAACPQSPHGNHHWNFTMEMIINV
jgi:hypothetical protein